MVELEIESIRELSKLCDEQEYKRFGGNFKHRH